MLQSIERFLSLTYPTRERLILTVLEFSLAIAVGGGLVVAGFSRTSWLFGAIASGVLWVSGYRWRWQKPIAVSLSLRQVGQTFVGLAVGAKVAQSDWWSLSAWIPLFLMLTLFILAGCMGISYLYARSAKADLTTTMLATFPGIAYIITVVAAETGRDVSLVAITQVLRLTTIVLGIPMLARFAFRVTLPEPAIATYFGLPADGTSWVLLGIALVLCSLSAKGSEVLRVPAPSFFGAIIAGLVFNLLLNFWQPSLSFQPPAILRLFGQIALGIVIGEYFAVQPILAVGVYVRAAIAVGLTLAVGGLAAVLAKIFSPWSWLTCILLTSPGGASEMVLLALAFERDVEIVSTSHLLRLILLNSTIPLWMALFRRIERRSRSS